MVSANLLEGGPARLIFRCTCPGGDAPEGLWDVGLSVSSSGLHWGAGTLCYSLKLISADGQGEERNGSTLLSHPQSGEFTPNTP